ncbi:DinB family protein [Janibacter hoylei]|uniref:DinB family protein n=1 Tax=Janibacter hoylei TaxID=364298 RepID=UPI0021A4C277|nr:DinB family protein [Janibacter hoylei]MCT1619698.1 DinB family protein [Janibacter hoylei]MCT2292870.1 DinB family protein [Janibacter hoylei]
MSGIDRATAQWYVDTALAKLLARADELVDAGGEELLCGRPDVEGANSVYALVVHCCGVMERWGGETIAGRQIRRDRAAEFNAMGTIDQLEALVAAQRRRWVDDLADYDAGAAPRGPDGWEEGDPDPTTQGFVVLHVIEELYQHLGHVDLTVDLVLGR